MYCIFDTETIGTPSNYNAPPSDLKNWSTARMVQIAWIEYDQDGNKIAAHDYLIKPDGFTIPAEVIKIHRITNERANEKGIPIKKALAIFREAIGRSKYLIAHNIQFDQNVVGSEFIRAGEENPLEDIMKVCTMRLTTDFCKIKGGWGGKYKWPKLAELHAKLFGVGFADAHDALVDTEALGRCFFKLQELGILGFKAGAEAASSFSKTKSAEIPQEELFKPLVNFGVHTYHSILRGAGSAEEYVKRAKELGHTTMVIADRSNVSASLEFFHKCKKADIKPILGCELNFNDNIGKCEDVNDEGAAYVHKVIVKNRDGFTNLNKLLFWSHTKGFKAGESRVMTDWLIENKGGLMVSISGHEGYVGDLIVKGRNSEAETYILRLKKEFGDDLFAEIKLSELDEQRRLNEFVLSMAIKHDIMVIMDNDVHYALPDGNELQDTVYCIGQNGVSLKKAKLFERRCLFYPNRKNYMDFNKKFGFFYPEKAIESFLDNSLSLAERCVFDFEVGVEKYPLYEPTKDVVDYFGTNVPEEIIYKMAHAKLKKKLKEREKRNGKPIDEEVKREYVDRLSFELDVIKSKKMLDYFLVNWELIRHYKSKGGSIGPGRGSAAGCLLSWVLDITSVDPLRFGLYFERFLNPTRNNPPDIDTDFKSGTDDIVHAFLYEKYGKERAFPVGTFSTFNEKGCLKDVVRAHYGSEGTGADSEVNQVTKEMPKSFSKEEITLKEWFETYPDNPQCSPMVKNWLQDPRNKIILDQTLRLQGEIRGFGTHAAGMVITPRESWYDLPTSIISKQGATVSAFQEADGSSKDLSMLGILKLDLLKLSTINIVMDAVDMVKENHGVDITDIMHHIDDHFDDKNLYSELRLGLNHGIFQFESPAMISLIRGINVESFDELVAANALVRPGPTGIGAHTEYIHNKFNPTDMRLPHPALESILKETNGVMVYQEQIQFIANKVGGMSMGDGDMLRRYMDKAEKIIKKKASGSELDSSEEGDKDYQNFLKYWGKLLEGAKAQGHSEDDINKIRDYMAKYLGYSFNKSHSVSYGFVAMQTLYLKHYYPTEFYTSLLNNASASVDKEKEKHWMENTIASALAKGISVKTPSRRSKWKCSCTADKEINMGFSMINGFGEAAYAELSGLLELKKKRFDEISLTGFFELALSKFNKTSFNALLKAGVFDDWSNSREYLLNLKTKKKKKVADPRQVSAFDMEEISIGMRVDNARHPPTTEAEKLEQFIEVCGYDMTHISRISNIKKKIAEKALKSSAIVEPITSYHGDDWYYFFLDDIRHLKTKTNKDYLELTVGDGISRTKLRIFEPMAGKISHELERNAVYMTQFVKNEKNFLNVKRNSKFKKIVPSYSEELLV